MPWRREWLPTPVFLGFPHGSADKESACNVGDLGSIPELGRSPREGKGYPLQYSGLENSVDCIVHGVAMSLIRLSITAHFVDEETKVQSFSNMPKVKQLVTGNLGFETRPSCSDNLLHELLQNTTAKHKPKSSYSYLLIMKKQ